MQACGRERLLVFCNSHAHLLRPAALASVSLTCRDLAASLGHRRPQHAEAPHQCRHERSGSAPSSASLTAHATASPVTAELRRPGWGSPPVLAPQRPTMPPGYGAALAPPQQQQLERQQLERQRGAADLAEEFSNSSSRPPLTELGQLQLLLRDGMAGGGLPSAEHCNLVLAGCASEARWEDVWRCYQSLALLGVPVTHATLEALWPAAIKACFVAQGVQLFRASVSARGFPCQRSYTAAIAALLRLRRRGLANKRLAYELWKELEGAVGELDAVSLRTGMNACVEVGRISEALDVLAHMKRLRLRPGHYAYNILIKFYCKRGKMDEALKTFREMHVQRCWPDIATFNTLAAGYARTGDMERARGILDSARGEGCEPDVQTHQPYMSVMAREGNASGVRRAMAAMAASGLRPNAWVYAALVEAYIKAGDLPAAEEAAREMCERAKLPPSTVVYNLLIQAYIRQGYPGEAKVSALLDTMQMQGLPLDVDTQCLLLDRTASSNEQQAERDARAMVQQMRAKGLAPDAVQLTTLSKALVRAGRHDEALGIDAQLDACPNSERDMLAHNQRVHLLCVSGRTDEAERAADAALAYATQHSLPPPVEAFTALVQAYYRRRHLRQMMDAFRRFLRAGGKPNAKMANAVVRLCLLNGQLSAAFQAIRVMQLLGVDMNTERYKQWVMEAEVREQKQQQGSGGGSGVGMSGMGPGGVRIAVQGAAGAEGGGQKRGESQQQGGEGIDGGQGTAATPAVSEGIERLKWFLGLPNQYYQTDWRDGRR